LLEYFHEEHDMTSMIVKRLLLMSSALRMVAARLLDEAPAYIAPFKFEDAATGNDFEVLALPPLNSSLDDETMSGDVSVHSPELARRQLTCDAGYGYCAGRHPSLPCTPHA
jgi:hypothetical protein